jgi:hypothetical protein
VRFEPELATFAVQFRSSGPTPPVAGITATPRVDDSGALWFTAHAAFLGRLSFPATWLTRQLKDANATPDTAKILDALSGTIPLTTNPIIRLADDRRVRILGLRVTQGMLEVTCRTEGGG